MEELPRTWMIYLYQTTYSVRGSLFVVDGEWYGFMAMGLVLAGVVLEIVGSFPRYRKMLYAGVILVASGILFFTVGLVFYGYSPFIWVTAGETPYSTYLSYGYWLAVAAFAIPIVASLFRKKEMPPEQVEAPIT